jgi:hypothetical protein
VDEVRSAAFRVILRTVESRDSMIEIHIRISRKLIFWFVAIMLVVFALSWVLVSVGGGTSSSSPVKIGPVQTVQSPTP